MPFLSSGFQNPDIIRIVVVWLRPWRDGSGWLQSIFWRWNQQEQVIIEWGG